MGVLLQYLLIILKDKDVLNKGFFIKI